MVEQISETRMTRGVHVHHLMGTVFSFDLRDQVEKTALDAALELLVAAEARFSSFRPDSELCALWRGEIDEASCSSQMAQVLARSDGLAKATAGAFDARRWRADGCLDPTGLVKGAAAQAAADLLYRAGARNFAINAGGDIVAMGQASPAMAWRVGIRDPDDAGQIVATLAISDLAVATSGLYERADHIRDPRDGSQISPVWTSMTVVGPDLGAADAYATAALVLGEAGPNFVAAQAGYGAYGLHRDGRAYWTETIEPLLIR